MAPTTKTKTPPRWKRRHRAAWTEYVRTLADAMGLRDWSLTLEFDGDGMDADAYGTTWCTEGQRHAVIGWAPDLLDAMGADPAKLRMVAVHELVHLHLDAPTLPLRKDASDWMPASTHAPLVAAQARALEHATDAIARAWAELLPTPAL